MGREGDQSWNMLKGLRIDLLLKEKLTFQSDGFKLGIKSLSHEKGIERLCGVNKLSPTYFRIPICRCMITNFKLSAQNRIPESALFTSSKHFS